MQIGKGRLSFDTQILKRDGLLGPKLELAMFILFRSREHLTISDSNPVLKHSLADLVDCFSAVDHAATKCDSRLIRAILNKRRYQAIAVTTAHGRSN